jgi:two-component system, OmpR family, sensor histidine kinase TctE
MITVPPLPELRPAVNALNRLLADMNDTLQRLKTQESSARRFAYNASHELRNPLTAARNYLEVLTRHPTRTEATQGALGALDRTERILSSLLQLARLEGQGIPKRERIDLSSFLEAHFDVPVQGTGEVWAERDLLELSLENLVNNATHHAGGAKNIRVEARDDGTWLWVEDTGPGFNAELLPKAFEPFAKHGTGTGLGLAIVEAVARVHGGTVRAENRLEGGARVGLSIPAYFV